MQRAPVVDNRRRGRFRRPCSIHNSPEKPPAATPPARLGFVQLSCVRGMAQTDAPLQLFAACMIRLFIPRFPVFAVS
jgi:hypothetical protein